MTTEPDNITETSTPAQPELRELDLFALVVMVVRFLPFILLCGLIALCYEAVVMSHTKPRYASTATMIVPQGNVTSEMLSSQLSLSTIDLLGGGFELYGDIITSRRVADRLIADYDLKKVYGVQRDDVAEDTLIGLTRVQTQREGLIRVTVQDSDPQRAADLANDYLRQLDILNSQLVVRSISAQREYLEREMTREKDALADAEVALKEVSVAAGGFSPDAQASAGISAVESTRAQLRAAQIQLSALLISETDANPDVQRLRQQIASLNGQLNSLMSGTADKENGVPTVQVPEQALIYTRRLRDVKFHESLFDLLEKQFENAKAQEAKTPSIVQVLDPAVPAYQKAWPPRTYYCVLAGIGGLITGLFLAILWSLGAAYARNPRNMDKWRQLRDVYRWRSKPQQ